MQQLKIKLKNIIDLLSKKKRLPMMQSLFLFNLTYYEYTYNIFVTTQLLLISYYLIIAILPLLSNLRRHCPVLDYSLFCFLSNHFLRAKIIIY